MEEKRKFMRFDVLIDALCGQKESKQRVKITNFSRDGIGITSDLSFQEGENVEIELLIPGDNIPIITTGEIAWTAGMAKGGDDVEPTTGVKLKKIDNNDRNKILSFIYDMWTKQKKESD